MANITFADLRTEFSARGFSYLDGSSADQARRDRWINVGYQQLCEEGDWPFLLTTATGTSTVSLSDLREVLTVSTANGPLQQTTREDLLEADPTLAQTGTPTSWWLDGAYLLKTWPVSSASVTVTYLSVPQELTIPTQEPVIPNRYRLLIVDFAVIQALRDRSNFQEADALYQAIQPDLNKMRDSLLDFPLTQRLTEA